MSPKPRILMPSRFPLTSPQRTSACSSTMLPLSKRARSRRLTSANSFLKILVNSWQIFIQCRGSDRSRKKLFNHIWNQYQRRIIFFIHNMVKDNAEDLFQEVMLKVYQNLDKYNPLYSFNTWIYTIARNHCLNYLNKNTKGGIFSSSNKTQSFCQKQGGRILIGFPME